MEGQKRDVGEKEIGDEGGPLFVGCCHVNNRGPQLSLPSMPRYSACAGDVDAAAFLADPGQMVILVFDFMRHGRQMKRLVSVAHDGQLAGAVGADAFFVGAGVRAVGDAGWMEADRAALDAAAAGEVAVDVEENLVHMDAGMAVGA